MSCKYGLQLRVKPSLQKKSLPTRPSAGFLDDDDIENDIEQEIYQQASKNKALKHIEEQHKKALEEDPSVFDYDGVYLLIMKSKAEHRAILQDREDGKPKYIQRLMDEAKARKREYEIVYDRKLAKERSKVDHLYKGKLKFVTTAYKKELVEREKWIEEECLRQLQEEKEDITKKGDMSDFYFNLSKNVAFGARDAELREKQEMRQEEEIIQISDRSPPLTSVHLDSPSGQQMHQTETSDLPKERSKSVEALQVFESSTQENVATELVTEQSGRDHHKRNKDAVAAAKERFLARKRAKKQ